MATTELEKRCERLIDSSWYYSLYWRRHEHGSLTLDGWRDVRRDCARRISELQQRVDDLRRLLPQVEAMIRQRKGWERDDEGE